MNWDLDEYFGGNFGGKPDDIPQTVWDDATAVLEAHRGQLIPWQLPIARAMMAAQAKEADRIVAILKGIDKCEVNDRDGWWETSKGAKFGEGILTAILGGRM